MEKIESYLLTSSAGDNYIAKKVEPNLRLRQVRLERMLTLHEAAVIAEVSDRTYLRWEQGTQKPRLPALRVLCQST